ncbi:MAG: head-tail adaptor protein [Paracoccaceae bacterium]
MKAPHLNRALELEAATRVPDGAGGFSTVWVSQGTLWSEIVAGSGRDPAGVELILTSVPYRITVRAAPVGAASRPKVEQRFREGLRLFSILAVAERDQAGHYLTCFCKEEAPK